MVKKHDWIPQIANMKEIIEDAMVSHDRNKSFGEDKSRMDLVLKQVYNFQHRLAPTSRHVEHFETMPCMI